VAASQDVRGSTWDGKETCKPKGVGTDGGSIKGLDHIITKQKKTSIFYFRALMQNHLEIDPAYSSPGSRSTGGLPTLLYS
jgi:hypothetical protein